jgi:transcriptional regulator with GAF, ATPase, and Fis domain
MLGGHFARVIDREKRYQHEMSPARGGMSAMYRELVEAPAREFELTLADLTRRLLDSSPEDFERQLDAALEQLIEVFGADRGGIALFDADRACVVVATAGREGFTQLPLQRLEGVPNWIEQARRGLGFAMRSLEDLPAAWPEELAYCREHGIRANLMFPLRARRVPIGMLSLSSFTAEQDWSEEHLARFRLFGEILASAIVRVRAERDLRATLGEVSRLKERVEAENVALRETVRDAASFDEIIGRSAALRHALHLVEQVAPTSTAVLLTGETGTGKELVARAIHRRSARADNPLIAVNCAALPGPLIESELFGYERGAFTGALQRRLGRFEVASGGTIFLDEIGDLPAEIQGRLLRVLQEGTFERLGSSHTIRTDVRIIAATNRDLESAVEDGRWRADLYYRLKVFPIEVPPLRERREDIPLLAWYFVTRKKALLGRSVSRIPDRTMDAFLRYEWPGNVRELENVIERALILSPDQTLLVDERTFASPGRARESSGVWSLEDVERAHIQKVLGECSWRIAGKGNAAERLGLNRSTLRSRMEKLGIERPRT